jgi:hypothetical protein
MKTLTLALFLATSVFADDKPTATPTPAPAVNPATKQGTPTETQLLHAQKAAKDAENLSLVYKPDELVAKYKEYQAKFQADQDEFSAAHDAACTTIGVPKDKLAECQFDITYVDQATKKVIGKVSWTPAVEAPASIGKPAAK